MIITQVRALGVLGTFLLISLFTWEKNVTLFNDYFCLNFLKYLYTNNNRVAKNTQNINIYGITA